MEKIMRAVIFANGIIKHLPEAGAVVMPDDLLIAADGGASHLSCERPALKLFNTRPEKIKPIWNWLLSWRLTGELRKSLCSGRWVRAGICL
jgi:hypothetical protein